MSHNVYTDVYSENVDKKAVQKHWDNVAAYEDREEGCSGLGKSIRWIDHVCANQDEAWEYIKKHDSGWYDQLAVKFLMPPKEAMQSSTKTRLEKQIKDYQEKYRKYDTEHALNKQQAKLITCPKCGSKLAKEFIRSNGCPVCGARDIRSKTVTDTLKGYKDKIRKWQAEITVEDNKLATKAKKQSKIMWLVKIEFHT